MHCNKIGEIRHVGFEPILFSSWPADYSLLMARRVGCCDTAICLQLGAKRKWLARARTATTRSGPLPLHLD